MNRLAVLIALGVATACARAAPPDAEPLTAFVSVGPQKFFVDRIGGDRVRGEALVGPGQEPHTFEPLPRQLVQLSQAQLYFEIGLPFEPPLLKKARGINPRLTVIDMAAGIPRRHMDAEEGAWGHGDDAEAGEADPHVWMSPRLAKTLAANTCRALQAADPAHAADYAGNLETLQRQLDELDARLAEHLRPYKGRALLVFHPAFGYFADAYGLRQVAVEMEGKEPSARQVAAMVDLAKRERIRVVFVQPQFSDRTARTVAESVGARVVPLDDLSTDYLGNLDRMDAAIEAALRDEQP